MKEIIITRYAPTFDRALSLIDLVSQYKNLRVKIPCEPKQIASFLDSTNLIAVFNKRTECAFNFDKKRFRIYRHSHPKIYIDIVLDHRLKYAAKLDNPGKQNLYNKSVIINQTPGPRYGKKISSSMMDLSKETSREIINESTVQEESKEDMTGAREAKTNRENDRAIRHLDRIANDDLAKMRDLLSKKGLMPCPQKPLKTRWVFAGPNPFIIHFYYQPEEFLSYSEKHYLKEKSWNFIATPLNWNNRGKILLDSFDIITERKTLESVLKTFYPIQDHLPAADIERKREFRRNLATELKAAQYKIFKLMYFKANNIPWETITARPYSWCHYDYFKLYISSISHALYNIVMKSSFDEKKTKRLQLLVDKYNDFVSEYNKQAEIYDQMSLMTVEDLKKAYEKEEKEKAEVRRHKALVPMLSERLPSLPLTELLKD